MGSVFAKVVDPEPLPDPALSADEEKVVRDDPFTEVDSNDVETEEYAVPVDGGKKRVNKKTSLTRDEIIVL